MDLFLRKGKFVNILMIISLSILLISIIPIIVVSFYSHPLADDFNFSANVHLIIMKGGSIFDVLNAAFNQTADLYLGWQGLYSASFFNSLQPAVFSEKFYFLTTIIIISSLILSTSFLIITIFSSFGFNKKVGVIISCIVLFLSIQFVIDKHEAFFWWDGAEAYSLMYSFSLVLISLVIKMYFAKYTSTRTIYFVFSLILSVIIGGGNFSTPLITIVIIGIFTVIVYKTKKRIIPYYVIVIFVLLAGFIISIIAPGNNIRAAEETGESPTKAIVHSVLYAMMYIAQWTGLSQLACFIIIAIFAVIITKGTKYQYKYPFLVFAFSVLVFATQFTPPFYAMSRVGSGRQVNIYYYSYYLLIVFNIFYFCGWLNHKKIVKIRTNNIKKSYVWCSLILIFFLFLGGCFSNGFYKGFRKTTFGDTLLALNNGTPQAYSVEYMERIAEIKEGNTAISDIETVPDFFAPLNIQEDSTYWINMGIARYYNVDKITLKNSVKNRSNH